MIKRFTYPVYLLFTLLLATNLRAQQCSVNITSTDYLTCSGDSVTLTATANGPGLSIMASNTAGNNHRGNMFDIVATNSITILSFDASPMGNTTIEIYYKVGTWNGFANTPSAWTFVGSAPVAYTGGFAAVPVPVNVTIPAGQTYAFYVTSNTSAVSLNYSNGTAVGNVYSADANMSFLEGGGMEYPFTQGTGAVYQPRVWNGNIHYALADQPGTTYLWGAGQTITTVSEAPTTTTLYTVQSTIPGCAGTLYDTLDIVVSIPVIGAGLNQSVCEGDSILLHGTGGETYAWDNGVTDSVTFLPTLTSPYIVTGTDSAGCVDSDTVLVTVNSLPVVDAGTDYSICSVDSTTLAGQGANTYTWNNGVIDNVPFMPSGTSTYITIGTDLNGCVDSDTILVTVNQAPAVDAGPDQYVCFGTLYTLNGSGAVSYTWNNGVTDGVAFNPVNGSYIVTGADGIGCINKDTMIFTVQNLNAVVVPIGNTLLTSTSTEINIQWVNCAGYTPIAGATIFGFSPTVEGSYAVVLSDTLTGCVDTSSCHTIVFVGIEELPNAELSVYPMPTTGMITIASTGAEIRLLELTDLLGKVLQSVELNSLQTEIDLSEYPAATYLLRIYRNGQTSVLKVLKN